MTLPPFAVLMAGWDDTQSLLLDVEGKFDNVNLVVGGDVLLLLWPLR